jgi:hypothetical protein
VRRLDGSVGLFDGLDGARTRMHTHMHIFALESFGLAMRDAEQWACLVAQGRGRQR